MTDKPDLLRVGLSTVAVEIDSRSLTLATLDPFVPLEVVPFSDPNPNGNPPNPPNT